MLLVQLLLLQQQLLLLELLQLHLLQQPCLLHDQGRCLAARALPRSPRGQRIIAGWHLHLLLLLEQQLLLLLLLHLLLLLLLLEQQLLILLLLLLLPSRLQLWWWRPSTTCRCRGCLPWWRYHKCFFVNSNRCNPEPEWTPL